MARIPYVGVQSPFGNRGPDNPTPMNADTRGITNGMEMLAGSVARVGGAVADVLIEERMRDQALARAEASNVGLDDQIGLDAQTDEYVTKLRAGEIPWDQAEQQFTEAVDTREVPKIAGLNQIDQLNFEKLRKRNALMAKQKFQSAVGQYKKDYGEAQVYGTRDKLATFAENPGTDPDAIIEQQNALQPLWSQLSGDASKWEKDSAAFKDKVYSTNFAARYNATIDNEEGLKQLRKELSGDGYWGKRLGPEKANTLMAGIDRKIESNKNEAERDKRAIEKAATRQVTDVAGELEVGNNPGADRLLLAQQLAEQFPELKMQLQEAVQVGQVVTEVLSRPKAEQEAWMATEKSRLATEGGSDKERARYARIEARMKEQDQVKKNDPFAAPALATAARPINFADMPQAAVELESRMAVLQANPEQGYGTNLLRPAEAQQLKSVIDMAPPEKMPALLGQLYDSTRPDVYDRVIGQVGVTDPILAAVGRRYAAETKAGTPPVVSVGIAKGRALLTAKTKSVAMPKDSELQAGFADVYGGENTQDGAYVGRPTDFQNDIQAAKAFYANLTAEAGDLSGEFSDERWQLAMNAVTGPVADIEGFKVVPPVGMDSTRFDDVSTRAIRATVDRYKLNGGFFGNDFALRNVPGKPGLYFLINADQSGALVKDGKGNVIGVNLND